MQDIFNNKNTPFIINLVISCLVIIFSSKLINYTLYQLDILVIILFNVILIIVLFMQVFHFAISINFNQKSIFLSTSLYLFTLVIILYSLQVLLSVIYEHFVIIFKINQDTIYQNQNFILNSLIICNFIQPFNRIRYFVNRNFIKYNKTKSILCKKMKPNSLTNTTSINELISFCKLISESLIVMQSNLKENILHITNKEKIEAEKKIQNITSILDKITRFNDNSQRPSNWCEFISTIESININEV